MLKYLDMTGSDVWLKIDSHMKYMTKVGGFLTIIVVSIYIFLFFLFGLNFYLRTNPNSLVGVEIFYNYLNYTLNSSNMLFVFRADDESGKIVDKPEFLYYETSYIAYQKLGHNIVKLKEEFLKFRRCKPSDMSDKTVYKSQQQERWFCFEWPENGLTTCGLWNHEYILESDYVIAILLQNNP